MWNASKCDFCGDCLVKCQYINYNKDKAVSNIKRLMKGKDAEILKKCVTCCACVEYCSRDADPFDLILRSMEKADVFPVSRDVVDSFDDTWTSGAPNELISGDPAKPVLSLCVMEGLIPEGALDSRIFEGVGIAKGGDYFCRFGYMHIGMESPTRENARTFIDTLTDIDRDIVFLHDDCYAMVDGVEKNYNIPVPFNYMHIFEYLRNYLRENKKSIQKLGLKVAYQRPCASRFTPEKDRFLDQIFELIGVERAPRRYEGENALCCTAPIIRVSPDLADKTRTLNMDDIIASGADALITLCPMCDRVLRWPAVERNLDKIFIIDLCKMALGEKQPPGQTDGPHRAIRTTVGAPASC